MPRARTLATVAALCLTAIGYAAPGQAAGPTNDAFAWATVLGGTTHEVSQDDTGATREAGEPQATSAADDATVWFVWTAPATATFVITTDDSSFDTTLGVYTGYSLASLQKVASNDDDVNVTSEIGLKATKGTRYYLQVGGVDGATGVVHLDVLRAQFTGAVSVPAGEDVTGACVAALGTQGAVLASGCPDASGFFALAGLTAGAHHTLLFDDGTTTFSSNGEVVVPRTGCTMSGLDASFVTRTSTVTGPVGCEDDPSPECVAARASRARDLARFAIHSRAATKATHHLRTVRAAARAARQMAARRGPAAYHRTVRRTARLISRARARAAAARAVAHADSVSASEALKQIAAACRPTAPYA